MTARARDRVVIDALREQFKKPGHSWHVGRPEDGPGAIYEIYPDGNPTLFARLDSSADAAAIVAVLNVACNVPAAWVHEFCDHDNDGADTAACEIESSLSELEQSGLSIEAFEHVRRLRESWQRLKTPMCEFSFCGNPPTTDGYCALHGDPES